MASFTYKNIGGLTGPDVNVHDGAGNTITSTSSALDVNIKSAGGSVEMQVEVAASDGDNIAIKDTSGTNALGVTSRSSAPVEGPTGSGSSLAAAPVTIGGLGKTANPTAVTDGQVVNSLHDKLGKQVVVGSLRDLKSNQATTITSSTSETTIVTADATNFLDLYGLVITNTSATVCKVTIKDATAGTTRFVFEIPATDTRGFMLPESAAHKQAAANNNWSATCGTSVASIEITALFVKNL